MQDSICVSNSDEEMKIWIENATKKQTFYCHALGDRKWEKYTSNKNDIIHLKNKIGYVLFGNPKRKGALDMKAKIIQILEDDVIKPDFFEDFNQTDDKVCQVPSSPEQDQKFPKFAELLDNLFEFQDETTMIDSKLNLEDYDSDESDFSQDDSDSGYAQLVHPLEGSSDDLCSISESSSIPNVNSNDDPCNTSESSSIPNVNSNDEPCNSSESNSIPSANVDPQKDDGYILYYTETAQISQINNLITAIKSCSDNDDLHIAFIFVIAKIKDFTAEFRVIRVRHGQNKNGEDIPYFVDATGRCYDSWDNFLEKNQYPPCIYCYPKGGFYTCDEVENAFVGLARSPTSKFVSRFTDAADVASVIGGIGCLATTVLSLGVSVVFPVTAPFFAPALAASLSAGSGLGIWTTGRAVYQIIDKKIHKENLTDQNARALWLNAATGILAGASLGSLKYARYAARTGKEFGKALSCIVNGIEYSSVVVAGVNIGNQCYNMFENKKVTFTDASGLVMSLLFFYNAAVTLKGAEQIIKESQNDVIKSFKSQLSRRQKKGFNKVLKDTTAGNVVKGRACVIKTIRNIEDPSSYFNELNRAAKAANKSKSKLSFNKNGSGKVNLNNKVSVEPKLLNSMSTKSQQKLFYSSKKLNNNAKSNKNFEKNIKSISKKEKLSFDRVTFELKGDKLVRNDSKVITENKSSFVQPIQSHKSCSNIGTVSVKKKVREDNLHDEFIIIFNKISNALQMFDAGKEMYGFLMKYYDKNLKEKFAKIIENKIEEISKKVSEFYEKDKATFITKNHEYYRIIKKANTPWDYFETYFFQMFRYVPDRESVVIQHNDVGWTFMLPNKSLRVDFIFMATMKMCSDLEKISVVAFIQTDS